MLLQSLSLMALMASASPEVNEGFRIFSNPRIGQNGVACAHCHATQKDEARKGDGLIRSGHSLYGVTRRRYWRGDAKRASYPKLGDAIDVCVRVFQGGSALSTPSKRKLIRYLGSLSPRRGSRAPLKIQPALEATLDYERPKYMGGDSDLGSAFFYRACHQCHPKGRAGLGPALLGKVADEVARKVREGSGLLRGQQTSGQWMPFFGRDRLSDRQVAHVAAFVESLEPDKSEPSEP